MSDDLQTWFAVQRLYQDYTAAVDSANWGAWVDLFTEECEYKVQPRENFERGLPLCTLWFLSQGMLRDRAYGIQETLFHDPYYQRHVVDTPQITGADGDTILAEANYAVFRTKRDGVSTVFNVGRYRDRIVRTPDGLRFAARLCVYDTEMIPNSIIYPI
ncbi:aromatic-ring-hydroxylating dioxygenase subunit beta [Achromobacter sp. GG226]|uniref:aromatic-ring-hydroxylating dioxygenase subunit beta n=1 Tax=Verticiella alkaliphila TaxID=2779529 RepID=UPI001C0C4CF0|nr:aromatic-ring-hydroxylating dioxygenase subunit beta [Verticiella sp. GG226]MBU4611682.1 aromatic-ring-hydroxylating dioxygenase subunit beta [Verticiella sp. GG226]